MQPEPPPTAALARGRVLRESTPRAHGAAGESVSVTPDSVPLVEPGGLTVYEAGIDTSRLGWRLAASPLSAVPALRTSPGVWSLYREVDDFSALPLLDGWQGPWYFPQHNLIQVEGHPRADGLATAEGLCAASREVADLLLGYGIDLAGPCRVTRLDVTATLAFGDPFDGLDVLSGLAGLRVPGVKMGTDGGFPVQTVSMRSTRGRRVLGRSYDKAREALLGEPGSRVRFEDQGRSSGERSWLLERVDADFLRSRFEGRFLPMYRATEGVKVMGLPLAAKEIGSKVVRGDLTVREGELLAGFLAAEAGGWSDLIPKATRSRRRSLARDHGITVASAALESVEVDLARVLDAAMDASVWGSRG